MQLKKKKTPIEELISIFRDKLKVTVREFEFKPTDQEEKEKRRIQLDNIIK